MDLPVGRAGDVDVLEVSTVIFGVSSSQQQLTARISFWIPETHRRKACCCSSTFENKNVQSPGPKMICSAVQLTMFFVCLEALENKNTFLQLTVC